MSYIDLEEMIDWTKTVNRKLDELQADARHLFEPSAGKLLGMVYPRMATPAQAEQARIEASAIEYRREQIRKYLALLMANTDDLQRKLGENAERLKYQ